MSKYSKLLIIMQCKNHQNIWRASSSGCFTALLIMGWGGGGVINTFLLRVSLMCVIDRCYFEFSLMSIMTIEN